jgi:glycosyltransferase involved in cell wall biosynthesis
VRIAVITPEYPPDHIGGGGIVAEALAQEYAKTNEVRVFSAWDTQRSWRGDRFAELKDDVSVYRYPLIPLFRRQPHFRSVVPPNPVAGVQLSRDLKEWSPDVAHLHGYGYAMVDLASETLVRRKVPYIFTVHGLPQTPSRRGAPTRAAYAAYRRIGPVRTMARAHAVTAISRAVAEALPADRQITVVPNGITPLPASDRYRAARLSQRLELDPGVPVIAAAGRLSRSKGFDVLLRALTEIDIPRLACVVAGADAGELSSLRNIAALMPSGIKVSLPGWLDREGLADLFGLASVVAVPSRDEPFGLVALEAVGVRRRVVASRVGGLAEFLRAPVAELVDSEDPKTLASALKRALSRGPLTDDEERIADQILAEHSWPYLSREYEVLMMASR